MTVKGGLLMHGVVGMWEMDQSRRSQQVQVLKERIIPSVAVSPGFVAGIWARDPLTGKAHSAVVFENEGPRRVSRRRSKQTRRIRPKWA